MLEDKGRESFDTHISKLKNHNLFSFFRPICWAREKAPAGYAMFNEVRDISRDDL